MTGDSELSIIVYINPNNLQKRGEGMIDKNKLRGAAMAHGFTFGKLAKVIGITPETLNRNIAKNSLGVNHVKCIQELLHLSDNEVLEIFLSQQVLKFE